MLDLNALCQTVYDNKVENISMYQTCPWNFAIYL